MRYLKNKYFLLIILLAVIASSFFLLVKQTPKPIAYDKNTIRYAVIGDSYSNGEGATLEESWPSLLTKHLQQNGVQIKLVSNPSITGWTSQQAIDNELPEYDKSDPTFTTLLIGVNDWVQGVSAASFRKNLVTLIEHMQSKLPDMTKILIVTIPDFSATPTGQKYGQGRDISKGIYEFNQIIVHEANKRKIKVVDIYRISQNMKNNSKLISGDGLHPSATEYAEWETLIYPEAYKILKK